MARSSGGQRESDGLGLDAVELTFSELIPHLGQLVTVQRKREYTHAPGLEWSALYYLDLETQRRDAGDLSRRPSFHTSRRTVCSVSVPALTM